MEPKVMKSRIEKNAADVFATDEYSLFKYKNENRAIHKSIVNKIYESIIKHGWFKSSIIVVGDGMSVLDGQHRIEALKKFKASHGHSYKINYIVDRDFDNMDKIIALQTHRGSWNNDDYVESFSKQGIETYSIYKAFKEKYNFTHTTARLLVFGEMHKMANKFKSGKLICTDWGMANTYAKRLMEIKAYYPFATQGTFARAIIYFWKEGVFDHDEFIHKLSFDRERLYRVTTVEQYVALISDIYNFKRRDKINFMYNG